MFFSINNIGRGRPNISIVEIYESIIMQKGIEMPLTKKSFNILYERYKQLGGKIDFSDLKEGLKKDES
tara:strand:+ start:1084 stop:1287 length:204 start_codon:yes stop_codon:yes gene_type:complete